MMLAYRTAATGLLALALISPCESATGQAKGTEKEQIDIARQAAAGEPGQPGFSNEDWMTTELYRYAKAAGPVESVRGRMLKSFQKTDINGDGVSETDYTLRAQVGQAKDRVGPISQWLKMDLDADGEVRRTELETFLIIQARRPIRVNGVDLMPTPEQISQAVQKQVGDALRQDRDGNGVITFAEALASAQETIMRDSFGRYRRGFEVPRAFDRDSSGTVSEAEFTAVLDLTLGTFDGDHNGEFSAEEIADIAEKAKGLHQIARDEERARTMEAKVRKIAESCGFPQAAENAEIALVGIREGLALSTVSLGGDDFVVTVANVEIEPGPEPLYILLSSYAEIIWRFTGATERVAQVAASATRYGADKVPLVGIVGIPQDRVFVPNRTGCMPLLARRSAVEMDRAIGLVPYLVGRKPDIIVKEYGLNTIKLPSGRIDNSRDYAGAIAVPRSGPGTPVWQEMLRFNPGGLVEIEAETVISPHLARRYVTLPQQAGLAQLVEEGALEIIGFDKHVAINGARVVLGGNDVVRVPEGTTPTVTNVPSKYLVLRKIRLPAGLNGAHAVEFVLGPGVPAPEGSPGHSKVSK